MGGGNFFSLSNIIFTDQEAVLSTTSTTSMRPLVQSTNGTLDNRSQVLISECEFEGFKNGTFVFESFESDVIGDDVPTFLAVQSSVFSRNSGTANSTFPGSSGCCAGAIDIASAANLVIGIGNSVFAENNSTGSGGAIRVVGSASEPSPRTSVSIVFSSFDSNRAQEQGGALGLFNVSNVLTTGINVTRNFSVEEGGGIVLIDGGSTSFETATFFQNIGKGDGGGGGGVYVSEAGPIAVRTSNFTGNQGSALRLLDSLGSVRIETSTFESNLNIEQGGAVSVRQRNRDGDLLDLIVDECVFLNNNSTNQGGGFFAQFTSFFPPDGTFGPPLTVIDTEFTNNTCESGGAGLYAQGTESVTIMRSNFTGNEVKLSDGGAIEVENVGDVGVDVTDCSFRANRARFDGGALSVNVRNFQADVRVSSYAFDMNESRDRDGGGIFISESGGNFIERSNFTNNQSIGRGGAILVADFSSLDVNDAVFTSNHAMGSSGGIFTQNGTVSLRTSMFTGNSAESDGGAVFIVNATEGVTMDACSFVNNTSTLSAGAVAILGDTRLSGVAGPTGPIVVLDSDFNNNTALDFAGALLVNDATTLAINGTLFSGNLQGDPLASGGAALVTEVRERTTISDCTFRENNATGSGGALAVAQIPAGSDVFVLNTTFDENRSFGETGQGGAVEVAGVADASITFGECRFTNNTASRNGGAIGVVSSESATLLVMESSFVGNVVLGNNNLYGRIGGGGICANNVRNVGIQNSTFTECTTFASSSIGGGVAVDTVSRDVVLETSSFVRCSSGFDMQSSTANFGGGVGLTNVNGSTIVIGSDFIDNFADRAGGGIDVRDSNTLLSVLPSASGKQSTFIRNVADTTGGAIQLTNSGNGTLTSQGNELTAVILNAIFTDNTATSSIGGAIRIDEGEGDLNFTNNVFEGNEARFRGGAIDAEAKGNLQLTFFNENNIFDNNVAQADPDFSLTGYTEVV